VAVALSSGFIPKKVGGDYGGDAASRPLNRGVPTVDEYPVPRPSDLLRRPGALIATVVALTDVAYHLVRLAGTPAHHARAPVSPR
jgi:hypothetical protein